jgi:hypothetical protein
MTDTPSDGPGTPAVLVVLANPKDGRDNEFNRWYDDDVVKDFLAGALDGTLPLSDALDTVTLSLSAWQPHGRHRT